MSDWNPTIAGREVKISDELRTEIMRTNIAFCDQNGLPYPPPVTAWLLNHPDELSGPDG